MLLVVLMSIFNLILLFAMLYIATFFLGFELWTPEVIVVRIAILAFVVYSAYKLSKRVQPIVKYLSGKEQYDVSNEGLIVNDYLIPWSDINGFRIGSNKIMSVISILVTDPNKFLEQAKGSDRKMFQKSIEIAQTPFFIYASSKYFSPEDILKNLEFELQKHK